MGATPDNLGAGDGITKDGTLGMLGRLLPSVGVTGTVSSEETVTATPSGGVVPGIGTVGSVIGGTSGVVGDTMIDGTSDIVGSDVVGIEGPPPLLPGFTGAWPLPSDGGFVTVIVGAVSVTVITDGGLEILGVVGGIVWVTYTVG